MADFKIRGQLKLKDDASKTMKGFSVASLKSITSLAAGVTAAGVAFGAFAKRIIDYGDKLDKLNKRLGVSVEALDKLRQVGELSGVQFNTLTMALQRMTRRLAEAADGAGPAADALDDLGLNAADLIRLAPEEQFRIIAQRLSQVENGTIRLVNAYRLFDSEGVVVLQMVDDLNTNLENTTTTMNKLRTDEMARFNDNLTIIGENIKNTANVIVSDLAKAFNEIYDLINGETDDVGVIEWMFYGPGGKKGFMSRGVDPLFNGIIASGPASPIKPIPFCIGNTVGESTIPPPAKAIILPLLTTPPSAKPIPKKLPNAVPVNVPVNAFIIIILMIIWAIIFNVEVANSLKASFALFVPDANVTKAELNESTIVSPIFLNPSEMSCASVVPFCFSFNIC